MSQAAGPPPRGPATGAAALQLTVLAGELSICRLPAGSPAPTWAVPGTGGEVPPTTAPALTSISFTADETSVVCASGLVPAGVTADPGWRALAVAGPMDLDLTGVLASLTQPLADAGLALFAVSTYDTDYLLVRASALETAITTLRAAGHHVG